MNIKKLPRDQKEQMIAEIQEYFLVERGEELSDFAAESILLFFIEEIGPFIYNQAINDAKEMTSLKMISLEEDILSLEQPLKRKRR